MKDQVICLSGLNGIRAIAAVAVVFCHVTLGLDDFGLNPYVFGAEKDGNPATVHLGTYSVTAFFTLSGFLITYLLWAEKERQPIQIVHFYFRRILRIWPLYYSYLALCLAIYFLLNIDFNFTSVYYYIFFSANIPYIIGGLLPLLGHFWSLGVEEQFYLFWPWINRLSRKLITSLTISFILLLLITKIYLHIFIPGTILESAIHVTRFHCMLAGGLAAILFHEKHNLFMNMSTHFGTQAVAWVAVLALIFNKFHIGIYIDHELITMLTITIIMGQVTKRGLIHLENALLDFLGKISYGIYVIHPMIIFLFSNVVHHFSPSNGLGYLLVYTSVLSSTIIVAYISYHYLELPFLNFKNKRFSVIISTTSIPSHK